MNILKKIYLLLFCGAFVVTPVFSYGGGGGSSYSNPYLLPRISEISPQKNSLQPPSFPISFIIQGDPDEKSISIQINGKNIPVTISKLSNGTYKALATANDIKGTSALIKISVASLYSKSSIRTYIYPIAIAEGIESALSVNISKGTKDAPHEIILFNPEIKQNLCNKEQTFNDTIVDGSTEYTDIKGNENEKYIKELTKLCILNGYKETKKFKPNKIFNRAEAVKTVIKAFGYKYETSISTQPFIDVKPYEWFAPYLLTAKKYGIVKGYKGGIFAPDKGMNIVEGLVIVARASHTNLSQYQTGSGIWYNSYLKWGIEKGLIDANTKPNTPLTRGAFARIIALR